MNHANRVPFEPDRRAISTLLEFRKDRRTAWLPDDVAGMLRHQLDAPIHLSLGTFSAQAGHLLHQSDPPLDALTSLRGLLNHPRPPVELLGLVKRFAKSCRSDPDHPLPGEIVMLLYYAAIAAALVRLGESISDLPPAQLRRGVRWVSSRAWVDEDVGALLRDAATRLDAVIAAQGCTEP